MKMKKLILLGLMMSVPALASFDKYQLRQNSSDDKATVSAVWGSIAPIQYTLYGSKKNPLYNKSAEQLSKMGFSQEEISSANTKDKYFEKSLGLEVVVWSWFAGVNLNFVPIRFDSLIDVNGIKNRKPSEICGIYRGVRTGLTYGIGTTAYLTRNRNGVILRSNTLELYGLGFEPISYLELIVECSDTSNPNWHLPLK